MRCNNVSFLIFPFAPLLPLTSLSSSQAADFTCGGNKRIDVYETRR